MAPLSEHVRPADHASLLSPEENAANTLIKLKRGGYARALPDDRLFHFILSREHEIDVTLGSPTLLHGFITSLEDAIPQNLLTFPSKIEFYRHVYGLTSIQFDSETALLRLGVNGQEIELCMGSNIWRKDPRRGWLDGFEASGFARALAASFLLFETERQREQAAAGYVMVDTSYAGNTAAAFPGFVLNRLGVAVPADETLYPIAFHNVTADDLKQLFPAGNSHPGLILAPETKVFETIVEGRSPHILAPESVRE